MPSFYDVQSLFEPQHLTEVSAMGIVSLETLRRVGTHSMLTEQQLGLIQNNRRSSFGSPITDSFYGLNYMSTPLPVPMNKDHYGYVFITRPQLNLQTGNLEKEPKFSDYLTTVERSVFRAARCYLDPRLQLAETWQGKQGESAVLKCPLVDPLNPFISLLSNHITAASGFQAKITPIYRSPEGQEREVHSMVDGSTEIYNSWTLPLTFRNSKGDPITKIFDLWVDYPGLVFKGVMARYIDYMRAGLLDYQSRIYRVLLDETKTYVTGIAAPGVAFPTNVPKDQQYDFNVEKPFNDGNNQITIQFECNGLFYEDFRLVHDFNTLVGAYHPGMKNEDTRKMYMTEVPAQYGQYFNCRAYPHINPENKRMEWFVGKDYFDAIFKEARELVNHMVDNSTDVLVDDKGYFRSA